MVGVSVIDGDADESGNTATFLFSRSGNLEQPLTVRFTSSGSATEGQDYEGLGGSVTFAPGSAEATLTVSAYDDGESENSESLSVSILPARGYVVGAGSSSATIVDRPVGVYVVNFNNHKMIEGQSVWASINNCTMAGCGTGTATASHLTGYNLGFDACNPDFTVEDTAHVRVYGWQSERSRKFATLSPNAALIADGGYLQLSAIEGGSIVDAFPSDRSSCVTCSSRRTH